MSIKYLRMTLFKLEPSISIFSVHFKATDMYIPIAACKLYSSISSKMLAATCKKQKAKIIFQVNKLQITDLLIFINF